MPTYDYACAACGHRIERFESISDDGAKACPKCGKKKSRRLMGAGVGLIFKGSGFYTTDSRRPAPAESDSGSKDSGSSGDSNSGSSDSAEGSAKPRKKKTEKGDGKSTKKEKESKT